MVKDSEKLKIISKKATVFAGIVYSIIGFIGLWAPTDQILFPTRPWWFRVLISVLLLILIWLGCFLCSIGVIVQCRQIELFEVSSGHHVYVQYGDFFDKNIVKKPAERRNLVLAVNRCFDTIVDDELIRSSSLHGQAVKRLCDRGGYSQKALSNTIRKDLERQDIEYERIKAASKYKGNLLKYPVGSVSEIKMSDMEVYFLLGLTWLDSDLHAHYSAEDYIMAMNKLLEYCKSRSQNYPVILPLIGAESSGDMGYLEKDLLEYIIHFLKLNRKTINFDIHIVVKNSGSIAISSLK